MQRQSVTDTSVYYTPVWIISATIRYVTTQYVTVGRDFLRYMRIKDRQYAVVSCAIIACNTLQ